MFGNAGGTFSLTLVAAGAEGTSVDLVGSDESSSLVPSTVSIPCGSPEGGVIFFFFFLAFFVMGGFEFDSIGAGS